MSQTTQQPVDWFEVDPEKVYASQGLKATHAAWCPGEDGHRGVVVLQLHPETCYAYRPDGEAIPETAHEDITLVVCGCYSTSAWQPWAAPDGRSSPGMPLDDARVRVQRAIAKGGGDGPDRIVPKKTLESWRKLEIDHEQVRLCAPRLPAGRA